MKGMGEMTPKVKTFFKAQTLEPDFLALPLSSCVTQSKLFNLVEPQGLHLKKSGDNSRTLLIELL